MDSVTERLLAGAIVGLDEARSRPAAKADGRLLQILGDVADRIQAARDRLEAAS